MIKTFKLIWIFLKLNLQKDLIYRFNALFNMVAVVVYLLTFIWSLQFVLSKVDFIKGLDYEHMFVILMLGQLWWFVTVVFVRKNFQFIGDSINKGTLDMLLLKPMELRRLTPFLQFDFRHVFPASLAIVLIFTKINIRALDLWQIIGSVFFFLNGILITYSITSIFTSLTFWVGRNNAIFDIIIELPDLVRLPLEFFPAIFQGIFIFGLPVIVIINPTFQILYGKVDKLLLIWAILASLILYLVSEIVWRLGLKNYTSAN